TRSTRDWSSDVCSSDLHPLLLLAAVPARRHVLRLASRPGESGTELSRAGHALVRRALVTSITREAGKENPTLGGGRDSRARVNRSEERRVGKEWGAGVA